MVNKFLLIPFFAFGFLIMFTGKAFAAVDITLEDNKNGTVLVKVDTNDSYIDGMDFSVLYSDDVTINSVNIKEGFCNLGKKGSFDTKNIYIECFNDVNTEMSGTLAEITYSTEVEDYSFYLNQESIDLGSLSLGEVTDINKPVVEKDVDIEEENTTGKEEQDETFDKVREFLNENSMYILAGIILLVASILGISSLTSRKTEV